MEARRKCALCLEPPFPIFRFSAFFCPLSLLYITMKKRGCRIRCNDVYRIMMKEKKGKVRTSLSLVFSLPFFSFIIIRYIITNKRDRRSATVEARPSKRNRRSTTVEARPSKRNRRSATVEARPSKRNRRSATVEARPSKRDRRSATFEARPSKRDRRSATVEARPSKRDLRSATVEA